MRERPSKLIAGAGILCFVAAMVFWLVSSGDKAMAEGEPATIISKTILKSMDVPVAVSEKHTSELILNEQEGVVHHLSVFLHIESQEAKDLKVHLTSPSGTRVLLIDGATSSAVTPGGLKAWLGAEGVQPSQSLAAFAGEPAGGRWKLDVRTRTGRLVKWSVAADLSPSTKMAGMETYGEYGESGCDCRVGTDHDAGGLFFGILLLGLALLLRRR